ncbi:MAG TPA: NADH-quinone oxidoreductase subunit C [Thermoplasmata archaeon]
MTAVPAPTAPPAPTVPGVEDALASQVLASLPGLVSEARRTGVRRVTARAPPERIRDAVSGLKALGCRHLSGMSGLDLGERLEVLYHLSAPRGIVLSLRAAVPRTAPRLPTVSDLFPVAGIYEREIHDLFGIEFEGLKDTRPLLLYEGWPKGQYPLRKDWKPAGAGEVKHA